MSGHSVSEEAATRAILHGKMTNDYAGTRVYEYNGDHYFVPEKLWEAIRSLEQTLIQPLE